MAPRNTNGGQPVDPAILDFMVAANQYGSGPGYRSSDFTDEAKKLNYIQDLFYTGNFDLNDLLGIGPAPQDPGLMPQYTGFQNDLAGVYAGNPVFSRAFAEIDAGNDPYATAAGIISDAGQPDTPEQYLPMSSDPMQPGVDQAEVERVLTAYAENRQRALREQSEYAGQLDQWQAARDQFDVYNNPMSELQLRGSPSVDQDIEALRAQVDPRTYRGSRFLSGPGEGFLDPRNTATGTRSRSWRAAPSGIDRIGTPISRGPRGSRRRDEQRTVKMISDKASNEIKWLAKARQQDQQRNIRPSGRELDNRKRQQAIYMLLNGEVG